MPAPVRGRQWARILWCTLQADAPHVHAHPPPPPPSPRPQLGTSLPDIHMSALDQSAAVPLPACPSSCTGGKVGTLSTQAASHVQAHQPPQTLPPLHPTWHKLGKHPSGCPGPLTCPARTPYGLAPLPPRPLSCSSSSVGSLGDAKSHGVSKTQGFQLIVQIGMRLPGQLVFYTIPMGKTCKQRNSSIRSCDTSLLGASQQCHAAAELCAVTTCEALAQCLPANEAPALQRV
jgi:hypothetical protein